MQANDAIDSKLHYHLIRSLIGTGAVPDNSALQKLIGADTASLVAAYRRLETSHSIVCHPGEAKPWVIHPFSVTPTAVWVAGKHRGWWSPCIWCALGVAVLVGEDVVIHSRIGGETEDVDIHVEGGVVRENQVVIHFAVPVRSAWNNVHHFCGTVLPFHSDNDVNSWSRRHSISKGAVVPIHQVADLARFWYGTHADPDWRKWTAAQARNIFQSVGLVGDFWDPGTAPDDSPY